MTITAVVSLCSTAPGVDAYIFADGELVGSCSLLPDVYNDGELATWGDCVSCWADYDLVDWLADGNADMVGAIVEAVRDARTQTLTD